MKLRNKKTGEIIEYDEEVIYYRKLTPNGHEDWTPYHPEDWEDYAPAEPLIKDEKIRKAVKAMADITGVSMLYYEYYEWSETVQLSDMNGQTLTFKSKKLPVKALESYTIAELCGEEEE